MLRFCTSVYTAQDHTSDCEAKETNEPTHLDTPDIAAAIDIRQGSPSDNQALELLSPPHPQAIPSETGDSRQARLPRRLQLSWC